MAKRFLTDEDKTELQNDLSGVQQIAENASKTVQEVSVVAQEAAENAKNAYSPLNKPTASDVGAYPIDEIYISELTSPAQLTKVGKYRFDTFSTAVNDNVSSGGEMSDIAFGDFHCELISSHITDKGCQYGTFMCTSPRMYGRLWIAQIWDYKFSWWSLYKDNRLFLPLDGSVAMTGGLSTVNQAMVSRLIDNVWHTLRVYPSSTQLNGKPSAILEHVINNVGKSYLMFNETGVGLVDESTDYLYNLYGEHNITKGTASLEAGTSALPKNGIYLQYE